MRIGLDIGGTKVAAALLNDSGRVLSQSWREHDARGLEGVATALADAAAGLISAANRPDTAVRPELRPEGCPIGVSVSGLVRSDGFVTGGATLELAGDLAGALQNLLPEHSVRVFNDAEATLRSVLAAHEAEHGEPVRDAVLLTIGTGIGGAIIAGGRPVRGRSGLATELGHIPVLPPSGEPCVCGSSGCLEQFAGGRGLAALARGAGFGGADPRKPDGSDRATRSGDPERLDSTGDPSPTAKQIVAAALAGDETARELLEQAAACCARAIRALCVTVEPGIVFLGGSIAHGAADFLPARIEHHLRRWWPFAGLTSPPDVRLDSIGPHAAAVGAALLTRDEPRDFPDEHPTGTTQEDTAP